MPQFFFIRVKQASGSGGYVLNAQYGGAPYAGQDIILYQQGTGTAAAANELWQLQMTPSSTTAPYPTGTIATAANPDLVLGLGPTDGYGNTTVVICTKDTSDSTQLWELHPGYVTDKPEYGVLVNHQTQQVLNVEHGTIQNGTQIITSPVTLGDAPPGDNCLWAIEPFAVPMQQSTAILSALDDGLTLCLNVQGASMSPGTAVILWPLVNTTDINNPQWQSQSMWSYTLDGYIVSNLNSNLVLSLGSNNSVVVYQKQAANTAFQQWDVTSKPGKRSGLPYALLQFANRQNGQLLTVGNGAATQGAALVTAAADGSASQDWVNSIGYGLETILAQPPVPFPTAPAGSQAALSYDYISTNVDPKTTVAAGGIRSMYTTENPNLLEDYLTQVSVMQQPATVTDSQAWTDTVQQITAELSAASAVQGLYEVYYGMHSTLKNSDELNVTILANMIGVSLQAKAKGEWGTLAEGLVLAGVECVPDVGGALATLLQTTITLVGQLEGGGPSFSAFDSEISELQSGIKNVFDTLMSTTATQATMVQTDWGKMSAVARLTSLPSQHPMSLNVTDTSGAAAITAAGYGGEIAILQYLMPAAFSLCRYWQIPGWPIWQNYPFYTYQKKGGPPGWACHQVYVVGDVYNLNILCADIWNNNPTYPNQQTMTTLGNLGVNWFNLFNGLEGWKNFNVVPVQAGNNWAPAEEDGSWQNILLGTIWNCTSNTLTIQLVSNHDGSLSTPSTLTLGPHQSITFGDNEASHMHHHATSANVTIFDNSYSTTTPVLYFEMVAGGSCYTTWPVYTANNGYALTPESQYGNTYSSDNGPPDELTVWVVQN